MSLFDFVGGGTETEARQSEIDLRMLSVSSGE